MLQSNFPTMELADLLQRPEGKTLEFKRDLSSPPGVLRTLVAFANTAGGVLLVGVEDGTRHVVGVSQPLDMEERLTSLVNDSIQPRLLPDVDLLPWRNKHVLAIQVHPSNGRPHHLAKEGADRGVYVRVGSTNRRADPDLIAELHRFARGTGFDEQVLPEYDSEVIDFRAASECFSSKRPLRKRDLETLRLVARHQNRTVPTVGGLLLFGTNREEAFPDAWIQAGRFSGVDKSEIVDRSEIRLHLPLAIEAAEAFVRKHSLLGARIEGLARRDEWNLPPVAVREALVNAVAHADYSQRGAPIRLSLFSDRLEIENPGLLPFGLTVEDMLQGISRLRNRVLGRILHELGLMEQWGSGVQRMCAACRDTGLAEPLLEELGARFRVTLFLGRTGRPLLDEIDQTLLEALGASTGLTTADLARRAGLSTRAIRTRLLKLVGRGLIHEVGSGPHDPQRYYVLSRPQS